MNTFDELTDQTFHSVLGRRVVDERGENIGTLDALWTDENTGKVEFIGVKTGWIFGKTHVVPARGVEIDDDNEHIRVPYRAEFVKDAPSYPADAELSDAQEREIYEYFGVPSTGTAVGTTAGSATTRSADEGLTADFPTAGAASTTAGTRADVTGADVRGTSDRGESVENPVVERGPTGAREPIGETAVPGARTTALPGDRDIADERRGLTGAPGERDLETERARPAAAGEVEIPTEEERLRVGTREVVAGRIRLRKIVRTEQASVPVELRREDVVVERVPADQVRQDAGSNVPEGQELEVEIRRQEPVVEKERVVTGAVRARKTEEVQRETVSDSVRKEDVEVDRSGVDAPERIGSPATDVRGAEAEAGTTRGRNVAEAGAEAERQRERERERPDV